MGQTFILIVLDGIGDRSHDCLEYLTPLQAAHTPTLDLLANRGSSGLYHATHPGQALSSENAHFAMFGYDEADFPGRGALEALGAGIALNPADVAVLAHFSSLENRNHILYMHQNKPLVSYEEFNTLHDVVREYTSGDIAICFVPTYSIFGVLTMQGPVSPYITDSNPMQESRPLSAIVPRADYAADRGAQKTAQALTAYLRWSYDCLDTHPVNERRRRQGYPPVNGIVTQRAGRLKTVVPLRDRYGLRSLSIASPLVYHGISNFLGIDCQPVSDSENPAADIAERLDLARKKRFAYDFIHIHSKIPDEKGHLKNPRAKKEAIEALDRGIGSVISSFIDDPDIILAVTADHSTPSAGPLIHSGEPVPLTLCGTTIRRDHVTAFDEISAASGGLGPVRGKELMMLILNSLDKVNLAGIMNTPVDQPYRADNYEPFRTDKN